MISKKTIIISVCVIILLAGTYFFLGRTGNNETKVNKTPQKEETITTALEPIFQAEKGTITSIKFSNSNQSYEFFNKDNTWHVRGLENILFNQSKVNSTVLDYVKITPALVVEKNPTDTSTYGFDKPTAKSVVTTSDGRVTTFYLGDLTKGGNGYYFMMDGSPSVYTVSTVLGNNMLKGLVEYRDTTLYDVKAEDIKEISMSVQGVGDVNIKHLDKQKDVMTSWEMTKPYTLGVYDEKFSTSVLTPVTSVQIAKFLSDNPTNDQLDKSGLLVPSYYYEVKTADKSYKILVGKNYDGYFTVKRDDLPSVYLVSADSLSFLFTSIFDYMNSYAYLPSRDTVSEISCNIQGKDYKFNLKNSADKDKQEFFVNDKKIQTKQFTDFYQKFLGVPIKTQVTLQPDNPNDVAFSFNVKKNDGSVDNVSYVKMNSKFMYMYINGVCQFNVYAEDVNTAMQSVKDVYKLSLNPNNSVEQDETDKTNESKVNWVSLIIVIAIIGLIAIFPISLLRNSKKDKSNKK